MIQMINGVEREWPEEIQKLWERKVEASPSSIIKDGDRVTTANYFTPRPRVDEYNTGSRQAGFTYTLYTKGSAGLPKVYQCAWHEEYDPGKHDQYRRQA